MKKIIVINYDDNDDLDLDLKECRHIVAFDGEVKIAHGLRGYLTEYLSEAPEDMEFMLIEKSMRPPRVLESASVTPTGKIRLRYSDGSDEIMEDANKQPEGAPPGTKIDGVDTSDLFTSDGKWEPEDES